MMRRMSIRRNTSILLLSLAVTSCAGFHSAALDEHVVITLERGSCYGPCPVYTVTIRGDRSVLYDGRGCTYAVGKHQGMALHHDLMRLVDMFESAHFFDLQDQYDSGPIDAPTYRVTYERHGQRKTVEESGGEGMPYVVRELEDEIDRVAQTGQWLYDPNPRHWPNVCAVW